MCVWFGDNPNSRALPLYASLVSLGSSGYTSLVTRNILFARHLASFLSSHPAYKLLTPAPSPSPSPERDRWAYQTSNILLFALSLDPAHTPASYLSHPDPNALLLTNLNRAREGRTFWTGTVWRGQRAVRLAVCSWMTGWEDEEREGAGLGEVREVLDEVVRV